MCAFITNHTPHVWHLGTTHLTIFYINFGLSFTSPSVLFYTNPRIFFFKNRHLEKLRQAKFGIDLVKFGINRATAIGFFVMRICRRIYVCHSNSISFFPFSSPDQLLSLCLTLSYSLSLPPLWFRYDGFVLVLLRPRCGRTNVRTFFFLLFCSNSALGVQRVPFE